MFMEEGFCREGRATSGKLGQLGKVTQLDENFAPFLLLVSFVPSEITTTTRPKMRVVCLWGSEPARGDTEKSIVRMAAARYLFPPVLDLLVLPVLPVSLSETLNAWKFLIPVPRVFKKPAETFIFINLGRNGGSP